MIHVYTGDGKGKTTAALGLAIRAAGAGLKVYIGQFVKGGTYSEIDCLKKIKNITVEQFGRESFIWDVPAVEDIWLAREGLAKIKGVVSKGKYDVIILDEINVALHLKLLELEETVKVIKEAARKSEVILTGRNAHPAIIKLADLVSEIKDRKHYYKKGVKARKGIEF
jgi:cob(I)alamin adenosyltransferase